MPVKLNIILLLSFFFTMQISHALEIEVTKNIKITKIEAEGELGYTYTRGFRSGGEISALGGIEFNSRFTNKTGIQAIIKEQGSEINIFNNTSFIPVNKFKSFVVSLAYIYNGMPEYKAHSHTLLPVVSLNFKYAGVSTGVSFRFTTFFSQPAFFEPILSLSAYVNFVNNEKFRVGFFIGNFDDFNARNFAAFSLGFDTVVHIIKNWTVIGKVEMMLSGVDGLTTNFYGIAVKAGVKYTW